jgi:hypothetical protein
MDPVFGNLRTLKADGGTKLELTLNISPYARSRYDFLLRFLGQPLKDRLALIPDTLLSLEIRLNEELLDMFNITDDDSPTVSGTRSLNLEKPYAMRLFAGLRDTKTPYSIQHGDVVRGSKLLPYIAENFKGFSGMVIPANQKFAIDMFLPPVSRPDRNGYYRVKESIRPKSGNKPEDQIWARKFDPFFVIATGLPLLQTVSPNIKIEKSEQPAQLRLALGDFSNASIGNALKTELYIRERRISAGGALLLQAIEQQLRPKNIDLALKELQDQKIVCPLGGEYINDTAQPGHWKSTAWQEPTLFETDQFPNSYTHPIIDGMKWLRLDFAIDPNTLNTKLEIQAK